MCEDAYDTRTYMSFNRESSNYGRSAGVGGPRSGNRSFYRGSSTSKPVEIGKQYEVEITEISRQGDGVARVQGFVIFVKNGKVSQNVKVQVERVGARFATATLVA